MKRIFALTVSLLVATVLAVPQAVATPAPLPSSAFGVVDLLRLAPWSNDDLYWFADGQTEPSSGDLLLAVEGAERRGALLRVPHGATEPSGSVPLEIDEPGAPMTPGTIGFGPDGTIYVLLWGARGTVAVIDPDVTYSADRKPRNVPVGASPSSLAVGPSGTVYVTNRLDGTVSVIDPGALDSYTTEDPPPTIAVGPSPSAVAVAADGRIVVTNEGADTISVVGPTVDSPASTVQVGPNPTAVAVDPSSGTVYVANDGDHTLSVLGPELDGAVAPRTFPVLPLPTEPDRAAKSDGLRDLVVRNDGTVYALYESPFPEKSFVLSVDPTATYDRTTLPPRTQVGIGPFSLAIDARPARGTVYAPNAGQGTVSVLDTASISLEGTDTLTATVQRRDGSPAAGEVSFSNESGDELGRVPLDAEGTASLPTAARETQADGAIVTATFHSPGGAPLIAVTARYAVTPVPPTAPPTGPPPTSPPVPTPVPPAGPGPSQSEPPAPRPTSGNAPAIRRIVVRKETQRRRLTTMLAGRTHLRVRCSYASCQVRGNLTVSAATARRLGLKSRTVGTATARGRGRGVMRARIVLRPEVVRALRRHPQTLRATVRFRDVQRGVVSTTIQVVGDVAATPPSSGGNG